MTSSRTLVLIYLLILVGLMIATWFQSRAFFLGFVFAGIYFYFKNCRARLTFPTVIGISTALAIILIYISFFLKLDSTLGRLLIYKISFNMFLENPFKGIGLGNFEKTFLHYQAQYFKEGNYSTKELLLADNTYYAFNDYFQFVVELGVLGIALVAVYAVILFFISTKIVVHVSSFTQNFLFCLVIAISVAALFTHVLDRWYLSLALIFCLYFLLLSIFRTKLGRGLLTWSILILCILIAYDGIVSVLNFKEYRKLKNAESFASIGYRSDAVKVFGEVGPPLNETASFLHDYGEELYYLSEFKAASKVLEKAVLVRPSNTAYQKLGKCYQELGQYTMAERMLRYSIQTVPNRLQSRYSLIEYYRATKEIEKLRCACRALLALPVKIPSARTRRMRDDTRKILNSLEKLN